MMAFAVDFWEVVRFDEVIGFSPHDGICVLTGTGKDFPGGSDGKESAYNVGDPGLIPGLGRSHGEGHGNPLQYSCLENYMDRGGW